MTYEGLQVEVNLRDRDYPIRVTRYKIGAPKRAPAVKYSLIDAKESLAYWDAMPVEFCVPQDIHEAMRSAIAKVEKAK